MKRTMKLANDQRNKIKPNKGNRPFWTMATKRMPMNSKRNDRLRTPHTSLTSTKPYANQSSPETTSQKRDHQATALNKV